MKILIDINQESGPFKKDPSATTTRILTAVAQAMLRGSVDTQAIDPDNYETVFTFKVLDYTDIHGHEKLNS